jgi:ATPase family associated with various cellular activities (AAA)
LAGWRAAPVVARALANRHWEDPLLANGVAVLVAAGTSSGRMMLQPEVAARALDRLRERGRVDLAGARGSGRRTLAVQLAAERGEAIVMVDGAQLAATPGDAVDLLAAALRMARHEGALACVTEAAAITPELWRRVLPADVPLVRCYLPADVRDRDIAERMILWRALSADEAPATITAARVTPGEIARLATGAAREEADDPVPDLLVRLPTPYDWDDLILPPDSLAALRDFTAQVKLRPAVLEEWGFDRLTHLGSGLIALFAGPSGVGKTMATQVIARDLGLELFRIDLAGVVDKYIGETEKRLRDAFAFAELPGKLLMFDEADALFGTRTAAKDSHDRYANLEVNYLLQRIETFEGVAVLATNRKSELDSAFRRRLRAMIDFLQPGPAERLRLWEIALPTKAPDGSVIAEAIDRAMLAEKLPLTGADIKAAALSAAFLARGEGSVIAMRHVLVATQREMAKHGQTMRLPLAAARLAS